MVKRKRIIFQTSIIYYRFVNTEDIGEAKKYIERKEGKNKP